ncbi:MAG: DNA repair protein RecN [Chloroflexi bacterium]|nr:DNA repair protein RecN [Chloroflexota bacterium]
MLIELRIQEFAIIENLVLDLGPGLIVFTGETGAGKSIIVDAVEMILGGRAESVQIRRGADRAVIEGIFKVPSGVAKETENILEREALVGDPGFIVLGREIRREGRNICRVNGRIVTLAVLREIGEWLVDVHGQSEHLSLLRVKEHLNLLDRFAHVELLVSEYVGQYDDLHRVQGELKELRNAERDTAQRIDLLAYQINEIDSSALITDEEKTLAGERIRLANAEQLAELAGQAILALDEDHGERSSATDLLALTADALARLGKVDQSVEADLQTALDLTETAVDLAKQLRNYLGQIAHDPARLDEVEERLELIHSLERKYGNGIPAILEYAEQAREELAGFTYAEEKLESLQAEEMVLLQELTGKAVELSRRRTKAAANLADGVVAELTELKMAGAQFAVDLNWVDDAHGVHVDKRQVALLPKGIDTAEFLVAPNPGEGLRPLTKIASGGETTRLMLALKNMLANADRTPTLIFDEIDQGIGGRVGAIVGRKLWNLGREHQVLCITHLPQLAAFGDQHFNVSKQVQEGRTLTITRPLQGSERIVELAMMLGGESEPNLQSAAELLTLASSAHASRVDK